MDRHMVGTYVKWKDIQDLVELKEESHGWEISPYNYPQFFLLRWERQS